MISGVLDSIKRLKEEVANGTMPAYIGEPMVRQLVEKAKSAQALQQGAPTSTVVDKIDQEVQALFNPQGIQQQMPQMAATERPPIPTQVPPQNPMPIRERVAGIDAAQSNLPTQNMAGGGIVAFAGGGETEDEYDPFDDEDNEEYYADMEHQSRLAQMIAQGEADSNALTQAMLDSPRASAGTAGTSGIASNYSNAGEGIKFKDPIPTGGLKATQYSGDKDQARKYNVGNLRPSGFSYPGQVGVSPGGFAMFDSREAGINALNHDIGIKLNRGLDTPTKFISVYAPASDKNDVGAYSANVAKTLNIGPNDRIPNTPEARQLLANAITRQEGAQFATAKFESGGAIAFSGEGPSLVDADGKPIEKTIPKSTPKLTIDPAIEAAYNKEYGYRSPIDKELDREYRAGKPVPDAPKATTPAYNRSSIDDLLKGKMPAGPQNPFNTAPSSTAPVRSGIRSLMPRGGDEYTNIYPTGMDGKMFNAADASYLNQLLIESQKDPSYQPIKEEIAKLLQKNPGLVKVVEEQNIRAKDPVIPVPTNLPTISDNTSKKPEGPMTEAQLRKSEDRFKENKQGLFPGAPTSPAATTKPEPLNVDPQTKAENELLEDMRKAFKQREAAHESDKTLDNYLSILQGFLGMMGGTSPYAMVNIGQGASTGITNLLAARKQQGLTERALGRDQMGLMTAQNSINRSAADRALREKLGMGKLDEAWADNLAAAQKARQLQFDKLAENDTELKFTLPGVTKRLNDAAATKKDPDPKDVAEYNRLMQKRQGYINMLETKIPDPVRPGAGGNFAGFSAVQVK